LAFGALHKGDAVAFAFNRKRSWLNAFLVCFVPVEALAAPISYTVDPTQSVLTLSGALGGQPFQSQVSGSLAASYVGTITGNRDFASGTLQITGGNIAAQNGGSYAPPEIVPAPGNYGVFQAITPSDDDSYFVAVVHDFSFSLSSPLINSISSIDVSQLSATISSGEVDYTDVDPPTLEGGFSSAAMTGSLQFASGFGSVVDLGNTETLTIPIETVLVIDLNGGPLDTQLSGEIVATAALPEPTSVAIFLCGLLAVFYYRPRRCVGPIR
jgi:hypothetical protein